MIISSLVAFSTAVVAAHLVPAWGFSIHFFSVTFLAAFIIAWGVESQNVAVGVLYALGLELLLGLHPGPLPLAFLVAVAAYGLLQHVMFLKPVAKEGRTIASLAVAGAFGMVLWIVITTVSWGVLELAYHNGYPFSLMARMFRDPSLLLTACTEEAVFLAIMAVSYRSRGER